MDNNEGERQLEEDLNHINNEREQKQESEPKAKKHRPNPRCEVCDMDVVNLSSHCKSNLHKEKCKEKIDDSVESIKTCFKSRIATYRVKHPDSKSVLLPKKFMVDVKDSVKNLVAQQLGALNSSVKVNLVLFGKYVKQTNDDEVVIDTKSFNTRNRIIERDDDFETVYDSYQEEITAQADEFAESGSGWAVQEILYLEVNINKYSPLQEQNYTENSRSGDGVGSAEKTENEELTNEESQSQSSYIPLPKWIKDKKGACINVKNDKDNKCFVWAVLSALYPPADKSKNVSRVSTYKDYINELKFEKDMKYPISIRDIKKFEIINNISVNVFEINGKSIAGPIFHTKHRRDKHVNLLYIEENGKTHYCWIKDMSKLIRSQLSKYKGKMYYCDGCLLGFSKQEMLEAHMNRDCSGVKTNMPEEGRTLGFKNFSNKIRAPVVVYADFESMLKPITTCEPNPNNSYTEQYQNHILHSYGYFIKCNYDDTLSEYVSYRYKSEVDYNNCPQKFIQSLKQKLKPFAKTMFTKKTMTKLTSAEVREYNSAKKCHICEEELISDVKVRDHCHLTGKYRGAAHNNCNLNHKIARVIPIVFHNLSNYDSHFIIKMLKDSNVTVIPKSKEKFISFTIKDKELYIELRFIDSLRFMATSLEKLACNLSPDQFVNVKNHFPEKYANLLMKKGVFPYDYIKDWNNLEETKLPSRDEFYSSLYNCKISKKEYKHAQNVWNSQKCKTIGDYSDIYLKTDVLLLADIFENFRNICIETYQLDPAHYYTAPGLAWDAMLKTTRVQMELFTDPNIDMVRFVQEGTRGGLSVCCGKYAKANNKYMKDYYDPKEESKYIVYVDANNLYGWAMSQRLPLKDFRWMNEDEVKVFDVTKHPNDANKGYFLEVDLEYPHDLHTDHNDFPFCAESRVSDYVGSKAKKLIASLHDKEKYIMHYVNLKQALDKGLKLKKVHRILEFTQSQWLKPYIDLNTKHRTKAKNNFEKDFFKLMNNAVFGKTMENVDKRVDVRIINKWESEGKRLGARALTSRLNFHSCTIINEDLCIIQMGRTSVTYDKPIYVGFAVLELSKTLMYEFHYDYIVKTFKRDVTLLYTDTDSFFYEIRTDDFYDKIRNDLPIWFDTSGYSPALREKYNFKEVNKKVVGKFKDECNGMLIKEFIGIRSKCYLYECIKEDTKKDRNADFDETDDDDDVNEYIEEEQGIATKIKIKGVKRETVSNEDFRNSLSATPSVELSQPITTSGQAKINVNRNAEYRKMNFIRSRQHNLYTETQNRKVLENFDDKRFKVPNNKSETLAWGHKDINKFYFL